MIVFLHKTILFVRSPLPALFCFVKVKVLVAQLLFLLFVTPWTVAHQAPLSVGFSRQEYWGGLPFPSSGGFPNPGIECGSPALWTDFFTV